MTLTDRYLEVSKEQDTNPRKYGNHPDPLVAIKAENGATGGRVVDGVFENARGYVRLPYDEGILSKVDPIRAWVFLADIRDIFNVAESRKPYYEKDKVSINAFMADERMKRLLVHFEDYLAGKSFSHLEPQP